MNKGVQSGVRSQLTQLARMGTTGIFDRVSNLLFRKLFHSPVDPNIHLAADFKLVSKTVSQADQSFLKLHTSEPVEEQELMTRLHCPQKQDHLALARADRVPVASAYPLDRSKHLHKPDRWLLPDPIAQT